MKHNFKNMSGYVFNDCKVIERVESKNKRAVWLCECFCGNRFIESGTRIRNGSKKSCGCLRKKKTRERNTTHNKSQTRLYRIWCNMKARCNNSNNPAFDRYGGRGIKICDEWNKSFDEFYKWAKISGYTNELTIERVDNDGNYEPDNCKWANYSIQGRNKRNNALSEYKGKLRTRAEIAELTGLSYGTIRRREQSGIDFDKPIH
ncbi:hypothetical protein QUD39_01190 [Staphylococcus hyicus]|uniref:hypothetical protein n=1 Tax=Staphylococcus hyicus TaxID=1284 RepID=UPI002739A20A|nr:hypothetical protein [Staphylococcus hyicus]MDP4459875.1 hypothetical protein [Staphylococcus hyicus]